jgi:hypothetical protein
MQDSPVKKPAGAYFFLPRKRKRSLAPIFLQSAIWSVTFSSKAGFHKRQAVHEDADE